MKVSPTDNQLNFKINYQNKKAWDAKLLKAFDNSNLVKQINKKYPEAEVVANEMPKQKLFDERNDIIHAVDIVISLTKDKLFRWRYGSYNPQEPSKYFLYELDNMTLENIEKHSVNKPVVTKKQNFLIRVFKNLFD